MPYVFGDAYQNWSSQNENGSEHRSHCAGSENGWQNETEMQQFSINNYHIGMPIFIWIRFPNFFFTENFTIL